jgi:hypothetical protein
MTKVWASSLSRHFLKPETLIATRSARIAPAYHAGRTASYQKLNKIKGRKERQKERKKERRKRANVTKTACWFLHGFSTCISHWNLHNITEHNKGSSQHHKTQQTIHTATLNITQDLHNITEHNKGSPQRQRKHAAQ